MSSNAPQHDLHEHSRVLKKKTASDFFFLQMYYKYLIGVTLLIALPVIIMSAFWADIQGKSDMYQDASESWQACFTLCDFQVIPLAEMAAANSAITRPQYITCMMEQNCSLPCMQGIGSTCASIITPHLADIRLPNPSHFLNSLSYIGIQSVIFALLAHGNMYKALQTPSWLISACGFMTYLFFAIFTYYAVSPVLPVPSQTNTTLMSLLYYEGDYTKYRNLNGGDNKCSTGYKYVWVYLCFIILLAATILTGLCIGIYAEYVRYKSPNRKHYDHLDNTEFPRVLGSMGISFYIMFCVSKMMITYTELNAINDFDYTINEAVVMGYPVWFPQIWFPFAMPTVDLTTLLGISACISILRGFTVQSISAFGAACAAASVYAFSSWPAMVGAYEFYFHNNFDDFDTCKNYFTTSPTSTAFGYPDDNQAEQFCIGFRLALGASSGLFVLMHCIAFACGYVVVSNQKRGSFVHEQLDFETAALEYALSRNNSTTGGAAVLRANSISAFFGMAGSSTQPVGSSSSTSNSGAPPAGFTNNPLAAPSTSSVDAAPYTPPEEAIKTKA